MIQTSNFRPKFFTSIRHYNKSLFVSDLLALIREVIGPAMVAFVTFIATSLVDKNENGVPDPFEKEAENNGGSDKKNHFR